MLRLEVQVKEKEYIKLNLVRILRKPIIFVMLFMVYFIISNIRIDNISPNYNPPLILKILPFLVLVYIIALMPVSVIYRAKKYYKRLPALHEKLNYEITQSGLKVKGETFEYNDAWDAFQSLNIYKNWIGLIKINPAGYYIPGKYFTKSELEELIALANNKGIKIKGKIPA